jgi:hypothetical protein
MMMNKGQQLLMLVIAFVVSWGLAYFFAFHAEHANDSVEVVFNFMTGVMFLFGTFITAMFGFFVFARSTE